MKKLLFTVLVGLAAMLHPTTSSSQPFTKGTNFIGAGLGFGSSLVSTYSSQTPGFSVLYEHGIWEVGGPGVISLGGYLGFKSFSRTYYRNDSYSWSYTILGFRGAYHFNGLGTDLFDVYGGAMISYNISSYSNGIYDNYYGGSFGSGVGFTPFVGGRYFVSNNFALYSELGYGVAFFNIGCGLKF